MEKKSFGNYFPIMLDLSQFKPLVIGGGEIATRKVFNLIEFNSRVTVIAPEITHYLEILHKNNDIIWLKKEFQKNDIVGYNLVFAATANPQIDEQIAEECKNKNILLNVADVPHLCNFIMPATIKRGDLTLSIGSQGRAPFYVKYLKEKLSNDFPEIVAQEVEIASFLRDKMMDYNLYQQENIRNRIIDDFFKSKIQNILKIQGTAEAKATIMRLLNKYL